MTRNLHVLHPINRSASSPHPLSSIPNGGEGGLRPGEEALAEVSGGGA
jgi:hypothetical protein